MANLKFISTGSTTVTLSGNGLSNSFTANGSAYTLGTAISLADGEYVEFAGSTNDFSKDGSHYYQFSIGGTGTVEVEGDLISLINNNAFVKQYQFVNLFKDCSKITSIANLNFPASIADFCYSNMFAHCTGLVNGGTTLPATSVSRWCYNGMFTDCSSMTTPPTILAEEVAPFCYYQMFAGCTSLTEGPTLENITVEGRMNSNCMFKDCSNLSTIQVNFRNWPAEANINQSRKWLEGVSQTGLFVKPNVLATIPTGVVPAGWTLSSTYAAQIVVADQTYNFDAMSNTNQTKTFGFSYVGGDETLNINVDTTNLPSWLTYTTDSDSVDFTANGYQIDSSTTVQIPITFSAADAETKNVVATFNISNYPTATITVSTIPTFTFDAQSETDIVSSLMTYATGSNSISCQIEGTLPAGLSCVDGIITGVPTDFTNNYSGSFDVVYSASDARNVSSVFDLEIINATPDYGSMPLTFQNITNNDVTFDISRSNTSASINGGPWQAWNSSITLQPGQKVSLSSTETSRVYQSQLSFGGSGKLSIYGNPISLLNWNRNIPASSFVQTFRANNYILDASKFTIDVDSVGPYAFCETFLNCTSLTGSPEVYPSKIIYKHAYHSMFYGCSSIKTMAKEFPETTTPDPEYNGSWTHFFMFCKCSSLTGSTILPNKTLYGMGDYSNMFAENATLTGIQVNFSGTTWPSNNMDGFLYPVNTTGKFICPAQLNISFNGFKSGAPSKWTKVNLVSATIPTIEFNYADSSTAVTSSITSYVSFDGDTSTYEIVSGSLPSNIKFVNGTFSCIPSTISQSETTEVKIRIATPNNGVISSNVQINTYSA